MVQSPEYPDLPWVPPRSWTDANRTSVQLIVIHTTEGSAHARSAEDGAAYDQRRTDGTSTHYFHDSDSTIQCVRTADQAHTARTQGNRRGIHHELCGRTTIDWTGAYAQAMLRRAAKQCARDATKWGIPVRRLTSAQVASGEKGLCGHVEITRAFPADGGTHTDPGPNFPWSLFLDLVRAEMEGTVTEAELIAAVTKALKGWMEVNPDSTAVPQEEARVGGWLRMAEQRARNRHSALVALIGGISVDVDEQAISAAVLAGLPVSAIVSGIVTSLPPELARQVADEIAQRLQA